MDTETLIQRLTVTADPVARLRRPSVRLANWLALAVPYVALTIMLMSPRADLAARLTDSKYLVEQLAALLTSIAAGLAAFASIIPGLDRRVFALPLVPFAIWLSSLGAGCINAWIQLGPAGLSVDSDWDCFRTMVLINIVPAVTMALMLQRGAPLTPHLTTTLGGLAAAALGNFGLRLFHPQDASIMVLVWQMGTVFVFTALAGWAGTLLLSWNLRTAAIRRACKHMRADRTNNTTQQHSRCRAEKSGNEPRDVGMAARLTRSPRCDSGDASHT
ncbi:NrsF family protein [Bradyrhizobium lablabi]|uniref:NrsF family protein n=1 Tax=Bradyrhizobium lablabi TaxID=722472 RepID=UPI001BAC9822|nr:NrsF family protein [Bradyrhizobium lablabi]MBR0693576.1 DUF1109 domain-containing protein [Bradyrhizobium lablabi]